MNFSWFKSYFRRISLTANGLVQATSTMTVFSTVFFICPNEHCCSVNQTDCDFFPFYTKCGNKSCDATLFVENRRKWYNNWFEHSTLSLSSVEEMRNDLKKRIQTITEDSNIHLPELPNISKNFPEFKHFPELSDIQKYFPKLNIFDIFKENKSNHPNTNTSSFDYESFSKLYLSFKIIKDNTNGTMWLLSPGWSILGGHNTNIDNIFTRTHNTHILGYPILQPSLYSISIPLFLALGIFDAQRIYLLKLAMNLSSFSVNLNNNDLNETIAELQSAKDIILDTSIKIKNNIKNCKKGSGLIINGIKYECDSNNKTITKNEILKMMTDIEFDINYSKIISKLYDGWSQNRNDNECNIGDWFQFVAELEINGIAKEQDFGSGYLATGTQIVCHKSCSV